MHGIGLLVPMEAPVYLDVVDRPQYEHVQNMMALTS